MVFGGQFGSEKPYIIALGCGNKAADILHNYSLTYS
jgi:hypothetical protein